MMKRGLLNMWENRPRGGVGVWQLYLLHLRWEFMVTCQIPPWEVQAEDFVSKFQELVIIMLMQCTK
jgi:hypothetical protein